MTFNSLYGIPRFVQLNGIEAVRLTFNSLYGIRRRMRKRQQLPRKTFNSLYGILNIDFTPGGVLKTFNSLYGILSNRI